MCYYLKRKELLPGRNRRTGMKGNTMCLGIVGYGGMGSWHGNIVKDIDGLIVKGVYDIKPERGELAKERGFLSYHSLEELLSDEEIDIVLVSTPNDLHKPIAIQAMRAGKNVVSEKPVTLSSADLAEMIRVSEETGVLFTVHQNRRWDEDFLTIKKIYDENLLGGVFRIESRVHGSRGIPGDWRQEKEHGGGMVLDDMMLLGTLSAFATYAAGIFEPIQQIARNIADILSLQANIERVMGLLEQQAAEIKSELETLKKAHRAELLMRKLDAAGCIKSTLVVKDIPENCDDIDTFIENYRSENSFLFNKNKISSNDFFKPQKSQLLSASQQMDRVIRKALGRG